MHGGPSHGAATFWKASTILLDEVGKTLVDKQGNFHCELIQHLESLENRDAEFKETIKNARKKLETSVAPAMPCKMMRNCGSGASNKIKTKLACILEADDSTRMRLGNSIPHHLKTNAGKVENSLQHYNLVHKFIPMPRAMKILAAKAAVDKEKLEKNSAWNLTKVKSKKQVIDEARTSGATVHTSCVEIEFTLWSASSINPRIKIMLGNHQVTRKATEKLVTAPDHKWSTSFCNQAAEHNTR